MNLIEAIKQNNQSEFFRLLNLKTDPFGNRIIDEVDVEYGGSALYWAVDLGYLHFIDPLLKAGVDVNKPTNRGGATPVYAAAQSEHVQTIAALKAAIDTLDGEGVTPLFIATERGHEAAVVALLAAGADASIKTKGVTALEEARKGSQARHKEIVRILEMHFTEYPDGVKPVKAMSQAISLGEARKDPQPEHRAIVRILKTHFAEYPTGFKPVKAVKDMSQEISLSRLIKAIKQNNPEEFFRILNSKTDPSRKKVVDEVDSEHEASALIWATFYGHLHFIDPLIKAGSDVNKPEKKGRTPVFIAAENGHVAAIAALKAAGANVDTPNNDGATPVYVAACDGHAAAIPALKAAGANLDTPNHDGWTPVAIAAKSGRPAPIVALKAAGANVDTPNNDGATPVYIAAANGHPDAIAALKAAGANVDTPNHDGVTPVYIATENGRLDTIPILKAVGADVNTPDKHGWTPVCVAASYGSVAAIAALIAAGANVDTPNHDGATPVYIAAQKGEAKAIAELKAAGAAMDTPNNEGITPLFIAAKNGHAETMSALLEAGAGESIDMLALNTMLEEARKGTKPGHSAVVRILERRYRPSPLSEQEPSPMLTQFNQSTTILWQPFELDTVNIMRKRNLPHTFKETAPALRNPTLSLEYDDPHFFKMQASN